MFCECVHSEIIIAIIYFMPHDLFLGRYLSINFVKSSRGHGFLESQDQKKKKWVLRHYDFALHIRMKRAVVIKCSCDIKLMLEGFSCSKVA
jgi:hypothetical protein